MSLDRVTFWVLGNMSGVFRETRRPIVTKSMGGHAMQQMSGQSVQIAPWDCIGATLLIEAQTVTTSPLR